MTAHALSRKLKLLHMLTQTSERLWQARPLGRRAFVKVYAAPNSRNAAARRSGGETQSFDRFALED
jgi:hypothetical protein